MKLAEIGGMFDLLWLLFGDYIAYFKFKQPLTWHHIWSARSPRAIKTKIKVSTNQLNLKVNNLSKIKNWQVESGSYTIVNTVEWLWSWTHFFDICFCYLILNLLTNTNIALIYSVTLCEQNTKDYAQPGSFQHKLQHRRFHFWCLPAFIISLNTNCTLCWNEVTRTIWGPVYMDVESPGR